MNLSTQIALHAASALIGLMLVRYIIIKMQGLDTFEDRLRRQLWRALQTKWQHSQYWSFDKIDGVFDLIIIVLGPFFAVGALLWMMASSNTENRARQDREKKEEVSQASQMPFGTATIRTNDRVWTGARILRYGSTISIHSTSESYYENKGDWTIDVRGKRGNWEVNNGRVFGVPKFTGELAVDRFIETQHRFEIHGRRNERTKRGLSDWEPFVIRGYKPEAQQSR